MSSLSGCPLFGDEEEKTCREPGEEELGFFEDIYSDEDELPLCETVATPSPSPSASLAAVGSVSIAGPASVGAGACSEAFTITSLDTDGNAVAPVTDLVVSLASAGAEADQAFYSDSECTSELTAVTLPAGTNTGAFYFKSTFAADYTLSVTPDDVSLAAASSVFSVSGGAPASVDLAGSASVTAGACASYSVTLHDTFGNAASVATDTAVALSSGGSGAFYTASDCSGSAISSVTVSASSSSANVYFKNNTSGSGSLSASALGLTGDSGTVATSAAVASVLELSISSSSVYVAQCSGAITVTTKDSLGNSSVLSSTTTIQLAASSGSLFSDSSCQTSASSVSIAGGSNSGTFYYKGGITTGTSTVTASSTGYTSGTLSMTVASRRSLSLGRFSTCHLTASNTIRCWGYNSSGNLGIGSTLNIGDDASEMGSNLTATSIGSSRGAVLLGAGHMTGCAVLDDGSAKCWGESSHGQAGYEDVATRGDGSNEMGDNLAAISLGSGRTVKSIQTSPHGSFGTEGNFTCAILDNDSLKCWGRNNYGQLGQGSTSDLGDGAGEMGDSLTAISLGTGRTASAIALGAYHACALLDNSKVKCWGNNDNGQLGYGDTNARGDGASEMGDNLSYVDLGTGRTASAITAGAYFSCALLDNSKVKCWGSGSSGALGSGATSSLGDAGSEMGESLAYLNFGTGLTATAISGGYAHACAILSSGAVKCWGRNNYGQLGQGDANNRGDGASEMGDSLAATDLGTGRTAVDLKAGVDHTCARLDNGEVKCWGYNAYGQLGLGDTSHRGDGTGEMGDSLTAVSVGN